MKIFKFIVPPNQWVPDGNENRSRSGVGVVVCAATVEDALAQLDRYAKENGYSSAWARHARVSEFEVDQPAVLIWAEV